MEKSWFKALAVGSVLSLMLFVFAGCGSEVVEDDMIEGEAEAVMESEGSASVSASPAMSYDVNNTQSTTKDADSGFSNYDITLNNFVDGWVYPAGAPGGTVSPASGMKLVVVNVTVNAGNEFANVVRNDFKLLTDANEYMPTYFLGGHGRDEFPSFATLEGGESTTHDLVFEVPVDLDISDATFSYAETTSEDTTTMGWWLGAYM